MKIYLTAIAKAKPEFLSEIKTALEHMVTETKKEEACIQYDLHQGIDDANTFIFYEIWEDQAGLDIHNKQPYIQDFGALAAAKLQEPPIIIKMTKV
ncbi:quinol monooxygenase YgiN [Algoriphagus ratkowskyi]|uniref:Antibiotic biosynthesis monooxygenase n=1 Tax=Algoriphagus ratkowskyi TaxID=57028 RepID=A0A2W7R3E4_9BACT|nr:putative quinol monooxygenase [Algoriphagus ratkowskyi]PZX55348.1 quinol monooxygenase YgiN [Algoriphagus ratkowskyi]TXD79721.1 antibiotic biosynthesis monooxygenase [Algoriphagus ratkowskyi]